ncbi:MAG: SPOR domain-containing protein, partial [Pseudomonadota bacterium]
AALSTAINPPQLSTENSEQLEPSAFSTGSDVAPSVPQAPTTDPPESQPPIESSELEESLQQGRVEQSQSARPASSGSDYVVLGSFRDPEGPGRQWASLSAQRAADLAGLGPVYDTRGGLHRLLVGPFPAARARDLCSSLGTDCFTERTSG